MPSLGPLEILLVAALALIVFGPERLPDIARTMGRTLNQLKKMASEVRDEFQSGLDLGDVDDEPEEPAAPVAPEADPDEEPEPAPPPSTEEDR